MKCIVFSESVKEGCSSGYCASKGALIKGEEVLFRRGEAVVNYFYSRTYGDAELNRGGLIVNVPICTIFVVFGPW